jgi:iron(II)-dependent oxidoreductase
MTLGLFARKGAPVDARSVLGRGQFVPADRTELPGDPLARAMRLRQFGSIVRQRAQWADHPDFKKTFDAASHAIDEAFAVVPDGFVSVALSTFDQPGSPEMDCETESYLLARYAVTNAEFQAFVDAGGYEDPEFWPEDVWPHLISFKDQTEHPGPRFWRGGRHHRDLAHHPVIGVCFYEALAYAHWAGYRLPSDAEWQMAASWRTRSSAHVHRRYPWGDVLDLRYCNIWASGCGSTLPVTAHPDGAAPNGVQQLIGNVWEWTDSEFDCVDRDGRRIVGDTLLRPIRGGAYDTYFPWQTTSAFRSGLGCLARVHNVGFRCALDLPGRGDSRRQVPDQ